MITKVATIFFTLLFLASFAAAQEEEYPQEPLEVQEEEMVKPLEIKGKVTSVAKDSLTVDDGEEKWTFVVDKETRVIAKGAGHKQKEADAYDKPNLFTDLIKGKESVIVTYDLLKNGKPRAQTVRVL